LKNLDQTGQSHLRLWGSDNAYGVQQRRVARRYGIGLIPRRCFIEVISAPEATVDGIHLSIKGQRRMAEMIWKMGGPAIPVTAK